MPGRGLDELALLVDAELVATTADLPVVLDVTHDSRSSQPGSLFVAIRGSTSDGHQHVGQAVAGGAVAVCVEERALSDVPQLVVPDTRSVLGVLAAAVHDYPSREMTVFGVTGTNGKTTVTHYIESIAAHAGKRTGLIGTIQTRIGSQNVVSERTTPEASDLQRLLAEMRDEKCEWVATEVSSHGLQLGRVRGTKFEVAAFTNLSQDHLDFHADMEEYLSAKESLFHEYEVGTAVINIDDPAGIRIASGIDGPMVSVGVEGDARLDSVRPTATGTAFHLSTPWGGAEVEAPIHGVFNADNAALAAVCCLVAGLDFDDVVSGLETLAGVPGRFELISGADPVGVIVDYAHTPDGVGHAIEAARRLSPRRIIALIGAGGDRDREKRPLMGAAASAADVVVITSDNPRSEEPGSIVAAVASGVESKANLLTEVDRRRAIALALSVADDGDLVLILGRGHEPFQEAGGEKRPFDDRQVAARELALLRSSANSGSGAGSMSA